MSTYEAAEIHKAATSEISSWNSCYREPGTVEPSRVIVSRFAKSLTDPAPITAEALAGLGFQLTDGIHWQEIEGVEVQVIFTSTPGVYLMEGGELVTLRSVQSIGQLTALLLALEGVGSVLVEAWARSYSRTSESWCAHRRRN